MLQSKKLLRFKNLRHGFTTRAEGDVNVRKPDGLRTLAKTINVTRDKLVGFEQIHGTSIVSLVKKDAGKIISGSDGGMTCEKNIFIAVNTADCVPILFFNPVLNMIAGVHAGWRGIVGGIVEFTLERFLKLDREPENIVVAIGPYINSCCYVIKRDCKDLFVKKFGEIRGMLYQQEKNYHLNLAMPIVEILKKKGIDMSHIDYFLNCTSCSKELFFSYRRDKTLEYGEMAAFIGMT